VARALRSDDRLGGAVLVALTGYSLPEDQRATDAGFAHHVKKPSNLNELLRLVEVPFNDGAQPSVGAHFAERV
jgi:CheY-like chemotaxis protein